MQQSDLDLTMFFRTFNRRPRREGAKASAPEPNLLDRVRTLVGGRRPSSRPQVGPIGARTARQGR